MKTADKTLKIMLNTGIPALFDVQARPWGAMLWNVLREYHHTEEAEQLAAWLRGEATLDQTVMKLRALEAKL